MKASVRPLAAALVIAFSTPLGAQLAREAAIAKAEDILKQTIVHRTVFDGSGRVAGLVFRPLDAAVLPAKR